MLGVLVLYTFTMMLPTNVSPTLSGPYVATYLGAGRVGLRVGARTGVQDLVATEKVIDFGPRVTRYTTVLCHNYKTSTISSGSKTALVDIGDYEASPMEYLSGHVSAADNEITPPYSWAQDMGTREGAAVTVQTADGDKDLTIAGAYRDITSNGHATKATFDNGAPVL